MFDFPPFFCLVRVDPRVVTRHVPPRVPYSLTLDVLCAMRGMGEAQDDSQVQRHSSRNFGRCLSPTFSATPRAASRSRHGYFDYVRFSAMTNTTRRRLSACPDMRCACDVRCTRSHGRLPLAMNRNVKQSLTSIANTDCNQSAQRRRTSPYSPNIVATRHHPRTRDDSGHVRAHPHLPIHLPDPPSPPPSALRCISTKTLNASLCNPAVLAGRESAELTCQGLPPIATATAPTPPSPPAVIIAVVEAMITSASSTVAAPWLRAVPYTRLSSLGDRGAIRDAGGPG
ncbi:uncharacterized protein SCHCODRAFT_02485926 [Schizophyllum commune H4-8]|nr:uncharacterized protein SCHCODRAFT_02485926 [Schizophyllum commune H4-8]KAI5899227.1 hypothetical protein SCHCODRAFT_02485926 [Schizophyllum commune H4-8]